MNNLLATGVCCSELSPCCVIGDPTCDTCNRDIDNSSTIGWINI